MRKSCAPSKMDCSPTNNKENDILFMKRRKNEDAIWSTENFKNPYNKQDFIETFQTQVYSTNQNQLLDHEQFIKLVLSKPFICPLADYQSSYSSLKCLGIKKQAQNVSLYDPYGENALVLYEPAILSESEKITADKTKIEIHVVVDPCLTKFLRPHQRQGVKFMYDCVVGRQIPNNYGCIMADEMGLGKTLQCITVLWSLLKQGPQAKPEISKAIIVCPASLVKNWNSEIDKWLMKKLNTICIDSGSKSDIEKDLRVFMLATGKRCPFPVLIISYESFRLYSKILTSGPIGLVICDEGHRLKNKDNQTYKALDSLQTQKRILISGTPIQNDLLEYFSLVHFVNGGILGTSQQFKKYYENPIVKGRQVDASEQQRQLALERLNELLSIVNKCIIRRTASLLSKYLPTKTEQIVCCTLTDIQRQQYNQIINRFQSIQSIQTNQTTQTTQTNHSINRTNTVKEEDSDWNTTLTLIDRLKKLCNHPSLNEHSTTKQPKDPFNPNLSGKMQTLDCILALVKSTSNDKVVLVSNYTQTLDLFEDLCRLRGYNFVRLDGTMTIKKRHKIVTAFNDPQSDVYIFMLSSKAGGCGLNLIGANRLVMFDPDWNPANDDQAMARVWRDGQKKPVFIYRLITTATIEERILQRQFHKKSLSKAVVEEKNEFNQTIQNGEINDELKVDLLPLQSFSREELSDLFGLPPLNMASYIHQSLNCIRCINGIQSYPPKNQDIAEDLNCWNHCTSNSIKMIIDNILRSLMASSHVISFIFYRQSHEQPISPTIVTDQQLNSILCGSNSDQKDTIQHGSQCSDD